MDKLQEIGFRLDEVARLYTRRFEQRAQTLSLQLAQCKALVLLAENEGEALQGVSSDEIGTMVKVLTRVHSNLSTTINADSAQSVR
jgi:hypothetical protein